MKTDPPGYQMFDFPEDYDFQSNFTTEIKTFTIWNGSVGILTGNKNIETPTKELKPFDVLLMEVYWQDFGRRFVPASFLKEIKNV